MGNENSSPGGSIGLPTIFPGLFPPPSVEQVIPPSGDDWGTLPPPPSFGDLLPELFSPTAGKNELITIYRLYVPSSGLHVDSLSLPNNNGIHSDGALYRLYPSHVPGSAPLYLLQNPRDTSQWLTSMEEGQWKTVMILGYGFTSQREGTVPLYRRFNPSNGDHMSTLDASEGSGYKPDGLIGYVFPPTSPTQEAVEEMTYYNLDDADKEAWDQPIKKTVYQPGGEKPTLWETVYSATWPDYLAYAKSKGITPTDNNYRLWRLGKWYQNRNNGAKYSGIDGFFRGIGDTFADAPKLITDAGTYYTAEAVETGGNIASSAADKLLEWGKDLGLDPLGWWEWLKENKWYILAGGLGIIVLLHVIESVL
jgi:hypothetical protein